MIELINSEQDLARQKFEVLVPTMGALHAGHQSLIKLGKTLSDSVLTTIFVNPLQFESKNDLANYPKTLAADLKLAQEAGATAVFAPTAEVVYPTEVTKISAGEVGDLYEGASRAGHFAGVLTVMKRFFDLTKPNFAIFGEKDFQQLFLIKEMVQRLALPIEIIAAPTIRESDGLAMSSRNSRLTQADRKSALIIPKALQQFHLQEMHKILATEPGFKLDYLAEIDEQNFGPVSSNTQYRRVIIAGWVNEVRLLDNRAMGNRA